MNILYSTDFQLAIAGILVVMIYGYASGKADLSGTLTGGVLAMIIFVFSGWDGLFYFLAFFILGSLASKWKMSEKEKSGTAQENKGRRSAVHAYSNAGAAAFFALLTLVPIFHPTMISISVASVFSAALSDTLSSEIGSVTGKNNINILTLKKDLRGKDGVISAEGTVTGLAGSTLVGLIFYYFHNSLAETATVISIGMLCNLLDSVLGASLQRRGVLNNHNVNLTMTFAAGFLGLVAGYILTY